MSIQDAQKALAMIERARAKDRASEVKITRSVAGSPGTYNPETGEFEGGTEPSSKTYTAPGVKIGYEQKDVDGTLIQRGDQQLYVPALGFVRPVTNEQITVGGVAYTAVAVEVLAPGDADILYIIQIRGV